MESDIASLLVIISSAILAALLAVGALTWLGHQGKPRRPSVFDDTTQDAEFLFDGDTLIDSTPSGRSLLPRDTLGDTTAFQRLLTWMEPKFPGISERIRELPDTAAFVMTSLEDGQLPLLAKAEWRGGLTRVSIVAVEQADARTDLDPVSRRAEQEEVTQLRDVVAKAPMPIWRMSPEGHIIWANSRYLELLADQLEEGEDLTWPLQSIFTSAQDANPGARCKIERKDADTLWFDVASSMTAEGQTCFALPADSTLRAERALRDFMQTLSKTFAHLPTGIAIFDQARRLAMFNPALVDLTALPPDILSSRLSLHSFFDALRERSMIPEPRDYKSWRNEITDLEQAAASGLYSETWSLPAGQTYRVTGRPHPNGALALMIEDISTEMSQTRRYQAELELGQAVIDAMDEAIAVFSGAGVMVMSNSAYVALWDHDPAGSLGPDGGTVATCDHWRAHSAPSALWDKAEDFIAVSGPRQTWTGETYLSDGRAIRCRFAALSGGATLAAFMPGTAPAEVPLLFGSIRKTG